MADLIEQVALLADTGLGLSEYYTYVDFQNRRITINNEIDSNVVEEVILPLKRMEAEDSSKEITLILNTPGGSVLDGLVLCDIIDNIKCPLKIEVLGYALSMGAYILMAGYNNDNVHKVCHNFSFGLIHAGSVSLAGDARKVKQTQAFNDRVDEKVKNYVLTHSKITEDVFDEHEDEEWYLCSEDMLELGLVDQII